MNKTKISNKLILWGAADIGEGFIAIVSSTYLSIFLTDVALLPLGIFSAVMMITSMFDFVMAITAGGIIDSIKPMKWGKLRSWILICPPITAIFFIVHFISVPGKALLSASIITIGYILARGSYNLSYTANVSLINVMAKDQTQRSRLSSQRMIGSNIGRLMGNYLTPIIVAAIAVRYAEREAYPILMAFAGVFFILMNLIHFYISKGYDSTDVQTEIGKKDTVSFKQIITALSTNSQLLITVIIDLTSNVAALVLPSLAVYYYKYVSETPEMVPTHMLFIGLAGMGGALFVRLFATKVKSYKTFLLCVYLLIAACLFSTRFAAGNAYVFLGINVVVHLFTGMTQPFELNLYMDNVIYSEWKTGVSANSLIMGMSNLPVKLATVLKSALISAALIGAGYVAGDVTPELKQSLINAYSIIPACIPLVGFVFLKFFYKLTPEKISEMKAEIVQKSERQ